MKKIWITGASSGIGKALAIKFAEENWQVAISARRKELLYHFAPCNTHTTHTCTGSRPIHCFTRYTKYMYFIINTFQTNTHTQPPTPLQMAFHVLTHGLLDISSRFCFSSVSRFTSSGLR